MIFAPDELTDRAKEALTSEKDLYITYNRLGNVKPHCKRHL